VLIKGEALLTVGYANFSHVTIVFIAKYLFTGSVKILNKIVFKIAIKFISMRNPEISLLFIRSQSIQRGESSFQEKCMDFHEIHPRVAYDLAHVCIS
jgi:hypothetical protein